MTMKIIQVVGYKNSGKTTVSAKLTELLTNKGYRVGTIKNHGHGGKLKKVPGTDTERHLDAGATISTVLGGDEWLTSFKQVERKTTTDLIRQYKLYGVDIIIIEGLKHDDYPKIVLLRNNEDAETLLKLTNIKAVGGWEKPSLVDSGDNNYVYFSNEQLTEKQRALFKVLGIEE